jgi:hypothetical protein
MKMRVALYNQENCWSATSAGVIRERHLDMWDSFHVFLDIAFIWTLGDKHHHLVFVGGVLLGGGLGFIMVN